MPVFHDRLRDVFEIHRHFHGDGKGRITREPLTALQGRIAKRGVRPPSKVAGGE